MNINNQTFNYDEETGSAICIIQDKENSYVGTAQCAVQDFDMKNEKTGCEIAYHRAIINYLKHYKIQLQLELKGLKKYYYSISQSKQYNPNGYMAKMLCKQIKNLNDDILDCGAAIEDERIFLSEYLA